MSKTAAVGNPPTAAIRGLMHVLPLNQPQTGDDLISHRLRLEATLPDPARQGIGSQDPQQQDHHDQLDQGKTAWSAHAAPCH